MTLQEAFQIGTRADGYVKCTYAEIIGWSANKLFSVQKGYVQENKAHQDATENIGEAPVYIRYDVPIVTINQDAETLTIGGKEFVKCKLTDEARDMIYNFIRPKKGHSELMEIVKGDGIVCVRPVAIDWIPTNFQNAKTDDGEQLEDALAKAKSELDQAKAILAATATYTIL